MSKRRPPDFPSFALVEGESADDSKPDLPDYRVRHVNAGTLLSRLREEVVGQAAAMRVLSHTVAMHTWRVEIGDRRYVSPNLLLLGPTGCGKTLSATTVADACGVPFVAVEAASLVPSGIVGLKMEHIAERLWTSAEKILDAAGCNAEDGDIARLAESGVVFIDEFDKLADREVKDGESLRARVQRNLLRFVEGMPIHVGESQAYTFYGTRARVIDTAQVLFIAAGAFAGIEDLRTKRSESNLYKQMFGASERVVPEDVKNFGFLPELVGRFEVVAQMNDLSVAELVEILERSPRSPIPSLSEYAKACGIELTFTPAALQVAAHHARALGLGARGLQQLLFPLVVERLETASSNDARSVAIDRKDFERPSDLW